jgi:hypothetical protein
MDGALRSVCCCAGGEKTASEPGPVASEPCCCDRVVLEPSVAPVASADRATPAVEVAIPLVLPTYAAAPMPEPLRPPRAVQRGGPAREGPGLLVLKQTFLI